MLSILAIIGVIAATFFFIKNSILYKKELETPEDKNGLYDFIKIKDNIINTNHIINIKQVKSVQDEHYKIIIELDDYREPIFFDFDDDLEECKDVYEQIQMALDAAIIITD